MLISKNGLVPLKIVTQVNNFNAGEVAGFPEAMARKIVSEGMGLYLNPEEYKKEIAEGILFEKHGVKPVIEEDPQAEEKKEEIVESEGSVFKRSKGRPRKDS